MKCIVSTSSLFLMSATAVSSEICIQLLLRISRNITCLDLQEHRFFLSMQEELRIQSSLPQARPLEISFIVIRLWMQSTIRMFFHSVLIILKRWIWRKKSQTRWFGTSIVKRLWWHLSVFVLWHSTYWSILIKRRIVEIKHTYIIYWPILQRWLLLSGTK